MALMGSHGKNNNFFVIFGPLAWLVGLTEAFISLCYDFQGGVYPSGIAKLNFWFLAKIHNFIKYHGVLAQKTALFTKKKPFLF